MSAKPATGSQSFLQRHHFLLRRLHSLTGVVPIGVFLIVHLVTNSSVIWGALNDRAHAETAIGRGIETFQHEVTFINDLPRLLLIEIFGLWIPIAFHAGLGIVYALTGRQNLTSYQYQSNWRYTLQRWSGYIGVLFIFYHVATLRWKWNFLIPGDAEWSHYFASSTLAAALKGDPYGWTAGGVLVSLLYLAGVSLLIFHFANGLWTAAITWGVTVSEQAQRRWGYVCAALGVGLMGAGWAALAGFLFAVDYDDAMAIEQRMAVEKYGPEVLEELLEEFNLKLRIELPDDADPAGPAVAVLPYDQWPEEARERLKELAEAPYPGPPPAQRD